MRGPAKHLTKGVAIYGAGDAAIQIVNFVLLSVYVKGGFLNAVDYGALLILISVETFAKVISRWGLDGAFMRFYHDRDEGPDRQRMASTIVWFMLVVDSLLVTAALAVSGRFARHMFADPQYLSALRLMLVNTFLIGFTFLPFHAMRMRDQAAAYSGFTFARSVGTVLLRILFVIVVRHGITGMYLADLTMTVILLPWLWPWVRPLLRPVFSTAELRAALRFGLPRLPHGLAQQALDGGNKILLSRYISPAQLGVYQNGTTLGTAIKFFTSAFETAWAPFYYTTSRQPDAKQVFRKMTTYGVAVLVLLVAGTTAVARDAILVVLKPEYIGAARVIPLIATGLALQGVYLLTSIGLNLTRRTEFYPVATFAAAAVGLGSGVMLMPRYGILGAATAFLLSYLTQASVAFALAQRFYPVAYETGRLARVVAAGVAATAAGLWAVPSMPALAGLFARGAATVVTYVALLWVSGFFRPTERAFMREMIAQVRRRRGAAGGRSPIDAN